MAADILLVEDNPLNRQLIRDLLEMRGHRVIEAGSVGEGRETLTALKPDLVVIDIQIPGGGGETLLHEIRADPRMAIVPVVAITALAMRGDRERILAAGFDGYFAKPINTRTFVSELETFLEAR